MPDEPRGVTIGERVEPFRLLRGHQEFVSDADLVAEGPAVVHFWPFAYTGSRDSGKGCEAQVCGFGDRHADFEALGVRLVGVSHDSPFVLKKWQEELEQPYEFLSDYNWEAARAFGILLDEAFDCYRPLNTRAAFLLDRQGTIRHAQVTALTVLPNVDEALAAARELANEPVYTPEPTKGAS
jgi:glutaredoxin-dependent peroxiredoxin